MVDLILKLRIHQTLQQGVEAHKAGQTKEAARCYNAVLKAQPEHPDANHNLGVLIVGLGKIEEALPCFKAAIRANQNITQFWLSYINALIKLDRIQEAEDAFEKAKEFASDLASLDKFKQERMLQLQKQSHQTSLAEALQQITRLYNQRQFKQALNESSKLLKKFPNSVFIYNIIGAAHKALGELEQAKEAYQNALAIKPDYAEAHNNIGNVLKAQGKTSDAINAYHRAVTIAPNFAEAYFNLGNILKDQNKLVEALEVLRKAVAIKPNHAEALHNIGLCLRAQGKIDEAIENFKKALDIEPNFSAALNNIGVAYTELGLHKNAIVAYEKSITANSDNVEAFYNLGNLYKEQDKLEDAIKNYKKALAIKPKYAEALHNMGLTLKIQGNLTKSIDAFTEALVCRPNYPLAIEHLSSLETQLLDTTLTNQKIAKTLKNHTVDMAEMPKFQILKSIQAYLLSDKYLALNYLDNFSRCGEDLIANLDRNDQIFCSAYYLLLRKLMSPEANLTQCTQSEKLVYHLGESHCLSYAHRKIYLRGSVYKVLPKITFGGKAYHFSQKKENAYKSITRCNFDSLPNHSKVFISFGEIDCRPDEGFISASRKLRQSTSYLIAKTVKGYVNWFNELNQQKHHELYFFNVPASVYKKEISPELNADTANVIKTFNAELRQLIDILDYTLIDVHSLTSDLDGFSNNQQHIDDVHLSPSIIPMIERMLLKQQG